MQIKTHLKTIQNKNRSPHSRSKKSRSHFEKPTPFGKARPLYATFDRPLFFSTPDNRINRLSASNRGASRRRQTPKKQNRRKKDEDEARKLFAIIGRREMTRTASWERVRRPTDGPWSASRRHVKVAIRHRNVAKLNKILEI